MQIIEDITTSDRFPYPVVTVGSFDGVHLGHRKIIEEVANRANLSGGTSILVTFEPHPQTVVAPESAPYLLTTKEEKLELLKGTGLHAVCILTFSEAFSQMSPADFVKEILVEKIGLKEIIIGQNHAFGNQRRGRVIDLVEMGRTFAFTVRSVTPVEVDGRRVSSSWIRDTIIRGDVVQTSRLLGRNYSLQGMVVHGTARGRILRFPTANIQCNATRKLYPGDGVYAIWVLLNGRRYEAMMNIGTRPTFDASDHAIEVHIFNFYKNIYGQVIQIEVAQRLRDERRFQDEKELVAQMEKDKSDTLAILSDSFALTEVH